MIQNFVYCWSFGRVEVENSSNEIFRVVRDSYMLGERVRIAANFFIGSFYTFWIKNINYSGVSKGGFPINKV